MATIEVLRVEAYKDRRHDDPLLNNTAHDAWRCPETNAALSEALSAAGLSADHVIGISAYHHSATGRDVGSTTYLLFCRKP